MKSKLPLITIGCILFLSWTSVKAHSSAQDFTPAHLQAAENFLIAAGVNTKFPAIIETVVNAFANQAPESERAIFSDVMRKFMNKYYTWDILKTSLDKIYASEFTESELKELADFYNSSIGKKYNGKSVELLQKNMQLGQQVVAGHQSELQQMIKEAIPEKN